MVSELQQRMQESFQENVSEEYLMDCMRCGFCLPACPTYLATNQDETHSPRGRISLMKAMRDGDVVWDGSVEEAFDMCLGCRACEPACPAGVQYGVLIEETRVAVQQAKPQGGVEKMVRKAAFDGVFADQKKMASTVKLVQFYQRSGLQATTRKIGFLNLFPPFMKEMEGVLPKVESKKKRTMLEKPKTTQVAFFTGCLMDTLFQETNRKTIELLEWLGAEVILPKEQQCCGALHGHSGELEKGMRNAKANIDAFDSDDYAFIVNNAGGCGAFLSEYGKHLQSEPQYRKKAERFSRKTIDISSLFVRLGMNLQLKAMTAEEGAIVTYQDSCHLRNVNKVFLEPRSLLQDAPGFEYKELIDAGSCCGSAGIYNLLQPEMAKKILDLKMKGVKELQPAKIITSNPGCLMQMQVGIQQEGLEKEMQAVHIVDFLHEVVQKNQN
ncbi:glycolate oxidase iron-sulfur subunit [Planomicrobium stackebrandtii]|uniref:Glycolate oxidase iron-sulfur subunit n=1 Tax=Planomicrobium stackebrandtii TaxID=253160 RepID=A0ABU0GWX3_9BACL|nr:(Fe-S)-binding protein [Planomicrobium stackebrandtii]MDQ0429429.1 glycolate oxidase iron-sulfur subunit [Planomicrobium stackebrandtii]